ncbi:hypothetical protein L798_10980, partial [Zootermopsis nevadensis]
MHSLNYSNASSDSMADDNSSRAETDQYIFDRTDVRVIFITLYSIVFCCCFFGNLMVILVVSFSRRLRSITNFFLANLAVADFCVGVFCVYQNISIYLVSSWMLGDALCKMYQFVHSLSYTASIFILVVICTERYFAIIHPITCKQILTPRRLVMVMVVVWVASALYSSPRFIWVGTVTTNLSNGQSETICITQRRKYDSKLFDMINFTVLYVAPLAVMMVLYSLIAVTLWHSSRGLERQYLSNGAACSQLDGQKIPYILYTPKINFMFTRGYHHCEARILSHFFDVHLNIIPHRHVSPKYFPSLSFRFSVQNSVCISHIRLLNCLVTPERVRAQSAYCQTARSQSTGLAADVLVAVGPPACSVASPRIAESYHASSSQNVLRARRGVVRMLMVVVLAFALCNLPYHARKMWQYWSTDYDGGSTFSSLFTPLTFLVSYFNSGINPLLYAFMSRNFRKGMRELFCCSVRGGGRGRGSRHHHTSSFMRRSSTRSTT